MKLQDLTPISTTLARSSDCSLAMTRVCHMGAHLSRPEQEPILGPSDSINDEMRH